MDYMLIVDNQKQDNPGNINGVECLETKSIRITTSILAKRSEVLRAIKL